MAPARGICATCGRRIRYNPKLLMWQHAWSRRAELDHRAELYGHPLCDAG